jgi:hypothetical protein
MESKVSGGESWRKIVTYGVGGCEDSWHTIAFSLLMRIERLPKVALDFLTMQDLGPLIPVDTGRVRKGAGNARPARTHTSVSLLKTLAHLSFARPCISH